MTTTTENLTPAMRDLLGSIAGQECPMQIGKSSRLTLDALERRRLIAYWSESSDEYMAKATPLGLALAGEWKPLSKGRIPPPPPVCDDNDNDNILADEFGREYIDLTPTWQAVAGIIRLALESGTPAGRKAATEELYRMADAADRWNAHCRANREA